MFTKAQNAKRESVSKCHRYPTFLIRYKFAPKNTQQAKLFSYGLEAPGTADFDLLHETNGLLLDSTRKKATHLRDSHKVSFGSTQTQSFPTI